MASLHGVRPVLGILHLSGEVPISAAAWVHARSGRARPHPSSTTQLRTSSTPRPSMARTRSLPRWRSEALVPVMRCEHAQRRDEHPVRLVWSHRGRPPQRWRSVHCRRLSPATNDCHSTEPAGLWRPPSAPIASATRRRASACRSVRLGVRPVPGTRATGDGAKRVEAGNDEAGLEVACSIVHRLRDRPARSILPSVSTAR